MTKSRALKGVLVMATLFGLFFLLMGLAVPPATPHAAVHQQPQQEEISVLSAASFTPLEAPADTVQLVLASHLNRAVVIGLRYDASTLQIIQVGGVNNTDRKVELAISDTLTGQTTRVTLNRGENWLNTRPMGLFMVETVSEDPDIPGTGIGVPERIARINTSVSQ
jgi:hypothetical protein